MNLKRLFSGILAAAMAASVLSVSAFAGTYVDVDALDLTDINGSAITSLNGGDVVMLPVDVTSTDGQLSTMSFEVTYDTSVLTLGASATTNDDTKAVYKEKKSRMQLNGTTMYGYRDIIDSYDEILEEYTYDSGQFAVVKISDGVVRVTWTTKLNGGNTLTDVPEFYVIFTVNDGVAMDDDTMNGAYVTEVDVLASAASDTASTDEYHYDGTYQKFNQCYGAFQLTIDNDQLPYYVKSLTAKLGDKEASLTVYTNEDGSSTYVFPARITTYSGTDTTATVEIYADAYSDEACTVSLGSQLIASKEISLDSTVTSYGDSPDVDYSVVE